MPNYEYKCLYCGKPADDLHHLFLRMNDRETVIPLCRIHHNLAHRNNSFFEKLKQIYGHQQRNADYYRKIRDTYG